MGGSWPLFASINETSLAALEDSRRLITMASEFLTVFVCLVCWRIASHMRLLTWFLAELRVSEVYSSGSTVALG